MSRVVKDAEERKEELLQIGIRLYLQGGTKSVSIQNVIKEASVATGLFYYYFKTKEDFIEQALEKYANDFIIDLDRIVGDKKSRSVLDRLNLLMNQCCIRFNAVNKINSDEMLKTPWHSALESLMIQRLHKSITGFVAEGMESGDFRIIEPRITALYLVCGLMGVLLRVDPINNEKLDEEIRRLAYSTLSIDA